MDIERKIRTGPVLFVERRCLLPCILKGFFFRFLFHFTLLRCIRVFVRRGNGKDLEEGGRSFGEGQLNGGGLVSMSNSEKCFFFFFEWMATRNVDFGAFFQKKEILKSIF